MDPSIVSALIAGAFAFAGVVCSNIASNRKIEHTLETAQAVQDTKQEAMAAKIEEIASELKETNKLASKTLTFEEKLDASRREIDDMKKQIAALNLRMTEIQQEVAATAAAVEAHHKGG